MLVYPPNFASVNIFLYNVTLNQYFCCLCTFFVIHTLVYELTNVHFILFLISANYNEKCNKKTFMKFDFAAQRPKLRSRLKSESTLKSRLNYLVRT